MTLDEILAAIAERCTRAPERPALTLAGGRRLTYGDVRRELDALTSGLLAQGLSPGDAVVFSIRPSPEAVLLLLAIVRCGGTVVAADPGVGPDLFAAQMALLTPKWVMAETLLYAAARLRPVRAALERRGIALPNIDLPNTRRVVVGPRWPRPHGTLTYRDLLRSKPGPVAPKRDPQGPAMVVFTSGTTSEPKGVVHTSESIGGGIGLVAAQLALRRSDRVFSDQMHMIVPALMAGAEAVLPRRRSGTSATFRDLAEHRPTHAYWVPVQLQDLMGAPGGARLPDSLRVVILGSAPAPREFLRRCRAFLPSATRVYCAYAMTEMLPVSWVGMDEKLDYSGTGDLVGDPCPGVRVRIARDGEILIAGPNLCRGYLGQPPLSEVATGDVGRLSGGRLVLLGRKKDMIIRRAFNIYPALIEGAVAAIPGIRRCAMVGVYDDRAADEAVVLAIEPGDGVDPDQLRDRTRWEIFEGPHRVAVQARPDHILVTRIPLGGRSRKVDRGALQELVAGMIRC
jgi:acyl-CoA synthetase (AMP-forming)/AMP-acid ligase II